MRRFLVPALAVLLLAGCASRAASNPPGGKPADRTPSSSSARHHNLFARPKHPFTPVGTVTAIRAHRVNVRDLVPAHARRHSVNCTGSGPARSTLRITPSPASSQLRICLPVGGTLTVTAPRTAYHWSRPQLAGDHGVLQPTGRAAARTPITYRAAGPGVVQLRATGSPPAGSLAPVFMWSARVIVR